MRGLILMYHEIGQASNRHEKRICVSPADFRAHMEFLKGSGRRIVALEQLLDGFTSAPAPMDFVAVTFDDGYEGFSHHALPVLSELQVPATVFVVSNLIGQENAWMKSELTPLRPLMSAPQIREAMAAGVEIGCHSASHAHLTQLTDAQLHDEVAGARNRLSDQIGKNVSFFAYPFGEFGERERAVVQSAGYVAACSTQPGFNNGQTNQFLLRRIDVYGSDTLAQFRRKVEFGANRVTAWDTGRYYLKRTVSRLSPQRN